MSPYEVKLKAIGKAIKVCKHGPLACKNVKVTNVYAINKEVYFIIENGIKGTYETLHTSVKEASKIELNNNGIIYVSYMPCYRLKVIGITIKYKGRFKSESMSLCYFKTGYMFGIKDEIYHIMTEVNSKELGTGVLVMNRTNNRILLLSENREVYESLDQDYNEQCIIIDAVMNEFGTESKIKIKKLTEAIEDMFTPIEIGNIEVEDDNL